MGGELKKTREGYSALVHTEMSPFSPINPLFTVQSLATSDPLFQSMLKQWEKKGEGGCKGKHINPESAVTKGGLR